MKQRITIKQLNELNNKQKITLRDWWWKQLSQDGDWFVSKYRANGEQTGSFLFPFGWTYQGLHNTNGIDGDESLPLLSIGQMIEFLHDPYLVITAGSKNGLSQISYGEKSENIKSEELCDALWEAIKRMF